MHKLRFLTVPLVLALTLMGTAVPAQAQLGDVIEQIPLPDIPDEIEDPLGDAVDQVGEGVVGAIGDIPLDNATVLLGDDGVEAAINLSKATFPDGMAPVVLLSRSTIFPDSLSSGGAQGVAQAPLLVTAENELDERVVAEIERLGATNVIVLGNTEAISEDVVAELEALGLQVDRLGGPTRVETAIAIAAAIMSDATEAILARAYSDPDADQSQAYSDSLSVGPWAAQLQIPILLTQSDQLTATLRDYLEEASISKITIIGGDEAVAPAVADELEAMGITVERVAGVNRYATAVAVAVARGFLTVSDLDKLILAEIGGRDDVWVPGFAAAANGGLFNGPVLLTEGIVPPNETLAYVLNGLPTNLQDFGGAPVLCTSFVNLAACEAIALLMLGALTEAADLLGELPLVGDVVDIITGGDGGGDGDEDGDGDGDGGGDGDGDGDGTGDGGGEEECLLPPPFPCVPPPA